MKLLKQQVHANEVYKNGYTGKNVRIAVLDTGVFLHRDLRNRVFGFKDFVDGRGYCYDDNGHGTHVTGIICSNGTIKGIAPDAQVAAIKVLDREGNGKTNRVLQALEWIQEYKKNMQYAF